MTPERMERIREVLHHRQPDLTVLLDGVRKGHNLSAIMRSADSVGVVRVHGVAEPGRRPRIRREASSGSGKWVRVSWHPEVETAFRRLREHGFRLVVADPAEGAVDFREVDYTLPTALVVGAELWGVSEEALEEADARVFIPMHGMVESLNVSVAAALMLYEAERQRRAAGMYDAPRLPPERIERSLFEWGYPKLAQRLKERGIPYPPLRPDGTPDFSATPRGREG